MSHYRFTDLLGLNLSFSKVSNFFFDCFYQGLELSIAYRSFFERPCNTFSNFGFIERYSWFILFDYFWHNQLTYFKSSPPFSAFETFSSSSDFTSFCYQARVDYLAFFEGAIGAVHSLLWINWIITAKRFYFFFNFSN